jgi:CO dehydrogenase/acetyl-CoA synthase delta subunit
MSFAPPLKETFFDTERAFIAKEALKSVYGVSLYRGSIYLMVATVTLTIAGLSFWMVAGSLYPVESVELALAAISAMSLLALPSTLGRTSSSSTSAPNR